MRRTVKVLSYILISSIVTSLVFASDKKTEEELFKNKQMERVDRVLGIDNPDGRKPLIIRSTSKPYSGFLGTIVTPKQKQYPEVAEKTAQDWENYPTGLGELHLKAIRLILDKEDPSYKQ